MLTFLGNLINQWFHTFGYGGIVLAMALESCLIPLPSEIIMPVAGTFIGGVAGSGLHFSLIGVALAGSLGSVVGSLAAYYLGAVGGRPVIFKYGKYILVSRHDFDMAERWFQRYGGGVAFFSRMLPIIRTYISLPAGMSRMNVVRFATFTFLGSLPWCFALAYAGEKLGTQFGTSIGKVLHDADYLIGAVIVILVVLYVWRHFRQERAYDQQHAAATLQNDAPRQAARPTPPRYGAPPNQMDYTQPRGARSAPNARDRGYSDPNGPDAPTTQSPTIKPRP